MRLFPKAFTLEKLNSFQTKFEGVFFLFGRNLLTYFLVVLPKDLAVDSLQDKIQPLTVPRLKICSFLQYLNTF
jgi:hypothetical protein